MRTAYRAIRIGSFAAMAASLALPAEAGIKCKDGFQLVNGTEIPTPYCEDAHLAELARKHGSRVTAAEIRDNPNTKDEVCRWIGISGPAMSYCNNTGDGRDSGN